MCPLLTSCLWSFYINIHLYSDRCSTPFFECALTATFHVWDNDVIAKCLVFDVLTDINTIVFIYFVSVNKDFSVHTHIWLWSVYYKLTVIFKYWHLIVSLDAIPDNHQTGYLLTTPSTLKIKRKSYSFIFWITLSCIAITLLYLF